MAKKIYNIYCDESCHLLNDHNKTFVLGAIWVDKEKTANIFGDLRELKTKHGLAADFLWLTRTHPISAKHQGEAFHILAFDNGRRA